MSSALLSVASPLRRWRILVLLLAAVGGVGLAWLLVHRQPRKLTVAITTWPGYEYFYLAEQKQLALAEGLDLRVNQYTSLEDQRLAFVRGDVNVMATTLSEAIAVCQEVPARCPELMLVLDESARRRSADGPRWGEQSRRPGGQEGGAGAHPAGRLHPAAQPAG
jgi:hypothetical protein